MNELLGLPGAGKSWIVHQRGHPLVAGTCPAPVETGFASAKVLHAVWGLWAARTCLWPLAAMATCAGSHSRIDRVKMAGVILERIGRKRRLRRAAGHGALLDEGVAQGLWGLCWRLGSTPAARYRIRRLLKVLKSDCGTVYYVSSPRREHLKRLSERKKPIDRVLSGEASEVSDWSSARDHMARTIAELRRAGVPVRVIRNRAVVRS